MILYGFISVLSIGLVFWIVRAYIKRRNEKNSNASIEAFAYDEAAARMTTNQ